MFYWGWGFLVGMGMEMVDGSNGLRYINRLRLARACLGGSMLMIDGVESAHDRC